MFKKILHSMLIAAAMTTSLYAQIVYEGGEGPGKGKHIVFIASDHEYRAEQTCPAIARILAKHHGFKCTVLLGVDDKGFIKAGSSIIPGIEALESADAMFMFSRFLNPSDEWMAVFEKSLKRGIPIVGMRTASHAFKIPEGKSFHKFDRRYKREENGPFKNGFGEQILGNTFEGHYGKNHRQGTRFSMIPEQQEHPIFKGITGAMFCYAGGYKGVLREGMTGLSMTQPLMTMFPDGKEVTKMAPTPSSWTYEYSYEGGKKGRTFHANQGASHDILDNNFRRMIINAVYWCLHMEDTIDPKSNIDFVGGYEPTIYGMGGYIKKQKPGDYSGFESTIGDATMSAYQRGEWVSPHGGIQRFRFSAPQELKKETNYPLVVFLHGAGGRGYDNNKQLKDVNANLSFLKTGVTQEAYFLAPQVARGQQWVNVKWSSLDHRMPKQSDSMRMMFENVESLLADKSLQIDPKRVYICGFSMGGYGVWDAIQRKPKFFAAAIPVCGGGDNQLAGKLTKLPIWAWHGDQDQVIKVSRTRDMIEEIKAAGGSPEYTEVKGRQHNVWDDVFSSKELWSWLFEQSK